MVCLLAVGAIVFGIDDVFVERNQGAGDRIGEYYIDGDDGTDDCLWNSGLLTVAVFELTEKEYS